LSPGNSSISLAADAIISERRQATSSDLGVGLAPRPERRPCSSLVTFPLESLRCGCVNEHFWLLTHAIKD